MQTHNINILPASSDDLPVILALQKECYQSEAELYNEYDIAPLKQDLHSIEAEYNKGIFFLKAVINGQVAGCVRGYLAMETCYIGRLMVKREFQNQKIGQLLMQAMESRFSDCKRYELFTGYKSEKNLYLYHKLGYKEYKQQKINDNLTMVYLEKPR